MDKELEHHATAVLAQVEDLPLERRWEVLERALEISTSTPKGPEGVVEYLDPVIGHDYDWVLDVKSGSEKGPRLHWWGSNDIGTLLDVMAGAFIEHPNWFGVLKCRELQGEFEVASAKDAMKLKDKFCGEEITMTDPIMQGDVMYRAQGLGVWWASPHMGGCMGTRNGLGGCKNPQCSYRGEEKPDVG